MSIKQIDEPHLSVELDQELRSLLSMCFQKPGDEVFRAHRYFHEMPQHRWLIREGGRLVAHLAVHDKVVGTTTGELRIGGIAEVCVHPAARGRGFVRQLAGACDIFLKSVGIPFGMLFGAEVVYRSSGYLRVGNPIRHRLPGSDQWRVEQIGYTMVKPLNDRAWPEGLIDLRGPLF